MRLTLRTLLAWLDNVLPADQQKELTDKVHASLAAGQLLERIRRIGELATLSAPRLESRGLADDANSVAEYLDNTMPADRLEEFERICLASDLHLAEVAACHNLLADMARDPQATEPLFPALDPSGRHRLFMAITHRRDAIATQSPHFESMANAHQPIDAIAVSDSMVTSADQASTPSYANETLSNDAILFDPKTHSVVLTPLRSSPPVKSSRAAWILVFFAICLLLALIAVLWVVVVKQRGKRQKENSGPRAQEVEPEAAHAVAVVADDDAAVATQPEPEIQDEPLNTELKNDLLDPEPQGVALAPSLPVAPSLPTPVAPPTPRATPAVEPASPAVLAAPRVPQGDALAIAAADPLIAPTEPAAGEPILPVAAPGVAPGIKAPPGAVVQGFVGSEGLLLHKIVEHGESTWVPFPAGALMDVREDLLVPPGFHPEITVRDVRIRLLAGTRATLSFDTDGTPRIEIIFGRAVAQSTRRDSRLGIKVGEMSGTVTAGLLQPVAMHVEISRARVPTQPTTLEVNAGITTSVAGGLAWKQSQANGLAATVDNGLLQGIAPAGMLESSSHMEWNSQRPKVVTVVGQHKSPEWSRSPPRSDKLIRGACEAMVKKLAPAEPAAPESLVTVLAEMAVDRRAENRMVAVETLALLGEFEPLVELLCAELPGQKLEPQQWLRLEKSTVTLALARGANATEKLWQAFSNQSPPDTAKKLWAMAQGFSDEELAAGADKTLVESLDDPHLVVRRYASKCLCEIVQPSQGDALRYRPEGLPGLRHDGVVWWKSQSQKELIRWSAGNSRAVEAGSR